MNPKLIKYPLKSTLHVLQSLSFIKVLKMLELCHPSLRIDDPVTRMKISKNKTITTAINSDFEYTLSPVEDIRKVFSPSFSFSC